MKKLLSFLLVPVCLLLCAVGCGKNDEKTEEGNFYTVTEAYENGYLTKEDVMSIAYYHNNGRDGNEAVMSEDYKPLPMIPERLSTTIDRAVKDSFYSSDFWQQYEINYRKEDISYSYYGTYGNSVVLRIGVNGEAVSDNVWEEKIDAVTIYYRSGKRLYVWIRGN